MHPISIEQTDHLYWLGRYTERAYLTLTAFEDLYDVLLDTNPKAYAGYCEALNIPNIYSDRADFVTRYLFDAANPDSVYSNLSRAYDNAMVLRSDITSRTLSYVQMALDTLAEGVKSEAHSLVNIRVADDLMAFWGIIPEAVSNSVCRHWLRMGRLTERLDMSLRLDSAAMSTQSMSSTLATIASLAHRMELEVNEAGVEELTRIIETNLTPSSRRRAIEIVNSIWTAAP